MTKNDGWFGWMGGVIASTKSAKTRHVISFIDPDFEKRFNKAFPKATIKKIWKALKDAVDTSSDGRKPAEKKVAEAWVSRSPAFDVTQTYTAHR